MTQTAIVLAGGLGTRLRSVVAELPKAMAPINGRPFLEFLLDYLAHYNYTTVVLSVGYKADAIEQHFGNQYKGLQIKYVVEQEPLGTGGAILKALAETETDTETVLATNGDSLFACNLQDFDAFHAENHADLSIALKPMRDFDRYGTVTVDAKSRVTGFKEKQPQAEGLISAGVYLINKRWLGGKQLPHKCSMERDVLETFYQRDHFAGFVSDGYFRDIGIPEDFEKAQYEFTNLEY